MSTTPKHVFLSYCRDNKVAVEALRQDLINVGEPVWWDQDILPGQDWKLAIRRAIKEAYAVVVCLSEQLAGRNMSYVYPEISDAISIYRRYAPGSIFFIPVRFNDCEVPDIAIDDMRSLDSLNQVDLFPPSKRPQALKRLIAALQATPLHPAPTSGNSPVAPKQQVPQSSNTTASFAPLRDFLANLIPYPQDITRVASDTGFPLSQLTTGKAINMWGELLRECQHRSLLQQLIAVVGQEYPNKANQLADLSDPLI